MQIGQAGFQSRGYTEYESRAFAGSLDGVLNLAGGASGLLRSGGPKGLGGGFVSKKFNFLDELAGATDVNPNLIANLRKKGWTIDIVEEGHPHYAEMIAGKTSGDYFADMSIRVLKTPNQNVKQITVLEEFLHKTQTKIPNFDEIHPYPRYEIQPKDFMIRHKNMLGLQEVEVSVFKQLNNNYIKRFVKDVKRNPL